jgi:hypothetical protein
MREYLSAAGGIVGLVFSILGTVFTCVGLALALVVRPWFIGVIFLCVGSAFLTVGLVLVTLRLGALRRRARLLESGLESRGTIIEAVPNQLVRINHQPTWVVRYRYEVQGCEYHGRESMADLPAGYEPGAGVTVVYDPDRVGVSALKRSPS